MDQINQVVKNLDDKVSYILRYIERPTIVKGMVYLCLMLYAARLAPVPPKAVLNLFENVYFKLFVFSLILWTAQFSPSTSILIALAFMVTINYTTTGKVWEMMDNTGTMPPMAPTPEIAMQAASTLMANQSTQVVTNVAQNPNTLVVTPSIVQTSQGPMVVNPSVVIGSAVVTNPAGHQVVITPSVISVTPSPSTGAPTQDPSLPTPKDSAQAIATLSMAAASSAASDPVAIQQVANVAMVNVKTEASATAVKQLAEQAGMAVPGTTEKVEAAKQTALAGCYPLRNYDMSKVKPNIDGKFSVEDYQEFTASI
jgi:hypothetical protein